MYEEGKERGGSDFLFPVWADGTAQGCGGSRMCRYSLAMGSGLGWSLGGESAHEKMAIGAWAVDCILEAPRVKVGFGALGMGGF